VLFRLILGLTSMARPLHLAEPVTDERILAEVDAISRTIGLGRPVRLMASDRIGSPLTWGWLRPVIVVPPAASEWPVERLRVVLLHEIIHIRRLHWPLQILAAVAAGTSSSTRTSKVLIFRSSSRIPTAWSSAGTVARSNRWAPTRRSSSEQRTEDHASGSRSAVVAARS
jgi:hypothetical protein